MTITKLNETSKDQVRQLLEANHITIKKTNDDHFIVACPSCAKNEAFIYFNEGTRAITCNRQNNCSLKLELWEHIASKQGIEASNNFAMLKCINGILGIDFKTNEANGEENEGLTKEQKFLIDCNQIFFNKLNNSKDNEQVNTSLMYLEKRGYIKNVVKLAGLGFFPDKSELLKELEERNYTAVEAKELTDIYFKGIITGNEYQKIEELKNRIVFTWRNSKGDVVGFSARCSTNEKVKNKYMNSNGLKKTELLFNLDFLNIKKKEIVLVEGLLDALTGMHLSNEDAQNSYNFVALGGNSISEKQAQILKEKAPSKLIWLLDNDKAGKASLDSSDINLKRYQVPYSIVSIPAQYEAKDLDELIIKHPNIALNTIFKNNNNIETLEELNAYVNEAFKSDGIPDLHVIRKAQARIETEIIVNNNNKLDKNHKKLKDLNDTIAGVKKRIELLATNYEEDKPYSRTRLLNYVSNSQVEGLKTGFKNLDEYIDIKPSTLTFIAARPSHGKTTFMINVLRNMIEANPEQAFLFYSYEEVEDDIIFKLLLSMTDAENELKEDGNLSYSLKVKNHIKKYLGVCKMQEEQKIMNDNILKAWEKVNSWLDDERLQILPKKPNVEILSGAIIERVKASSKKVGAIFIDYVQLLRTETMGANRQQDIQQVCNILLDTTLDARVQAPIILGAQVNREVKTLATLNLDTMREAGDIEQIANIALGIWDNQTAELDALREELSLLEDKKGRYTNAEQAAINELKKLIKEKEEKSSKTLDIKILKNRDGAKDKIVNIDFYAKRLFMSC